MWQTQYLLVSEGTQTYVTELEINVQSDLIKIGNVYTLITKSRIFISTSKNTPKTWVTIYTYICILFVHLDHKKKKIQTYK